MRVFSGARRTLVHMILGELTGSAFGSALAQAGDLDGDGVRDFLVGAPALAGGYVYAFSGAGGALLWRVQGPVMGAAFGSALAGIADVDGDGVDDVLAGAPGDGTAGLGAGAAHILSGRDGSRLVSLYGASPGARFGSAVEAIGDLDGNQRTEFAIGAPGADRVVLYADRGSTVLALLEQPALGAGSFGQALARAADLNGDGEADFLVGAPDASGGGEALAGAGLAFSGNRLALHTATLVLGAASGGRVALALDAGAARAGQPYLLLGSMAGSFPGVNLGAVNLPLNFDTFTDLTLFFPNTPIFDNFAGVLNGAGRAVAAFDSQGPFDPYFSGSQVWFAFADLALDFASNAIPIELVD